MRSDKKPTEELQKEKDFFETDIDFLKTMEVERNIKEEDSVPAMRRGEKKKRKKKRRKKHYFLRFLILLAVLAGLGYFLASDFFDVSTITVTGTSKYETEKIIKLSKIKTETNIFKMKSGAAAKNIEKLTYVESVEVKRELPKKVYINIIERKPVAVVPFDKSFIVIDKERVVLEKLSEAVALTSIPGLTIKKMDLGEKLKVKENGKLAEAMEIIRETKGTNITFKKIEIQPKEELVKCYIFDNLICKGTKENLVEKIKGGYLTSMLQDLEAKGITRGTIIINDTRYCSFTPEIQ